MIRAVLNEGPLPPAFESRSLFRHHALALDADFESLCMRFDKQSVRQKTEKARRAGVVVEERTDPGGMAICHSLLAMTRRRLSLPPMPRRFFESIQRNLRTDHLRIILAYRTSGPSPATSS